MCLFQCFPRIGTETVKYILKLSAIIKDEVAKKFEKFHLYLLIDSDSNAR